MVCSNPLLSSGVPRVQVLQVGQNQSLWEGKPSDALASLTHPSQISSVTVTLGHEVCLLELLRLTCFSIVWSDIFVQVPTRGVLVANICSLLPFASFAEKLKSWQLPVLYQPLPLTFLRLLHMQVRPATGAGVMLVDRGTRFTARGKPIYREPSMPPVFGLIVGSLCFYFPRCTFCLLLTFNCRLLCL